jgi:hypothetical protein
MPDLKAIIEDIKTRPTVPVWPHLAAVTRSSRGSAYEAARRGDYETIRQGKRILVITSALRRKLGIE